MLPTSIFMVELIAARYFNWDQISILNCRMNMYPSQCHGENQWGGYLNHQHVLKSSNSKSPNKSLLLDYYRIISINRINKHRDFSGPFNEYIRELIDKISIYISIEKGRVASSNAFGFRRKIFLRLCTLKVVNMLGPITELCGSVSASS